MTRPELSPTCPILHWPIRATWPLTDASRGSTVCGGLASVVSALAILSLSRDAYYPHWHCNASKHGHWRAAVALASTGLCTLVIFTWKPQLRIYVMQLEAAYSKH